MVSAQPLIVAHRGASFDAPENTIPAFELAWEQGANAIEADFYLTADGEIVCFHDEHTQDIAGKKHVISTTSLDELRTLDVGKWHDAKWTGTRMPTLAEVLSTVPPTGMIFIEIKCGPEIIPKLFEGIRDAGLKREQVVIISFNTKVIYEIEMLAPEIKTLWLTKLRKAVVGGLTPRSGEVTKILKMIKADGVSSRGHKNLDANYIDAVKDEGYEYHVWTIDDVGEAKRFSELGVNSITTNVPEVMAAAFASSEKSP